MDRKRRRLASWLVTLALIAGGVIAFTASGGRPDSPDPAPDPPPPHVAAAIQIDSAGRGTPIRAGFLGLSIEFPAVRSYTGDDPRHINPVLVALIKNLSPGQAPELRIGGDSTDMSWVPIPGKPAPAVVSYALTPGWLATTAALAKALRARMILGINLAAARPALASAEARAYVSSFGSSLEALEIGNEPNVYGAIALFRTPSGTIKARPHGYGYSAFLPQFRREAAALPQAVALAGPSLAAGPKPNQGSWAPSLASFLHEDSRVAILTVHRYPLRNCFVAPSNPQYPTIPHLLAGYATAGLSGSVKGYVAIAHAQHRSLRVDELNSVACRGKAGVSDTFAASLWMLDALFELARLGVDGVNVHTLPRSAYAPFEFSRTGGRWRASVTPVYYGMQMFAQATPPGSRLVNVGGRRDRTGVSVWATRAPSGEVHVVLVNESATRSRRVVLQTRRDPGVTATVERLRAPRVDSRRGVTLGGRTYGTETYTGALGTLHATRLRAGADGTYTVAMPRASAAMLTLVRR